MSTARSAAKATDDKSAAAKASEGKTTDDKISEAPKSPAKADDKADDKAMPKNATDGETKSEAEAEDKATESYIDQAATLATDVRALAEKMREDLTEVECRCAKVNETAPEASAYAAADGVRRIPMATVGVHQALQGLVSAAAELATKAQHTEAE